MVDAIYHSISKQKPHNYTNINLIRKLFQEQQPQVTRLIEPLHFDTHFR